MLFDPTWTNVALKKTATASAQYAGASVAAGVDGIIDMDNTGTGNLTHSASCTGAGWWSVNLGGLYNITSLIMWNRYQASDLTLGVRMAGATLTMYNYFGLAVFTQTLSGNAVQTYPVALYYPSSTPTSTPSPTSSVTPTVTTTATSSLTASGSPSATLTQSPTNTATTSATSTVTASQTPSQTSSASASLSVGQSASITPSNSVTSSITPRWVGGQRGSRAHHHCIGRARHPPASRLSAPAAARR